RNRAQRWAPAESMHASGWRVGPALRVLGVGALVVALLTPALPGFGGRPILDHAGPGARVFFNPLVAIKPTLDTAGERTLFTVRADRQTYYRLTSLDVFDGEVWKQRDRRLNVPIGRRFGTVPTGDSIAGDVVQQTFTIVALAGPWLPAAYDPLAVSANVGDLRFESGPRAIIRPGGLTEGLSYTVESNVAEPDATVLDVPVTYNSVVLADYLRLPRDTPRSVHREARRIAGKERTPFRQALALQNHLRTFTYDEKVAAGHSFKTLTEFLTKTKRGYCEQFAGAMAVMARALGIPSRVAIGFGYGRFRGEDAVRITTEQAHAWVEIYFPQTGWIPFEPTPRAGVAQVPDYADRPDPVTPTTEPSVRPTASVSPSPDARGRNPEEDTGVGGGTDALLSAGMNLVLGIGVLAVLAAIVIAIATIRRRRRIALAPDARAAVSRRYVDFLTWCAGAGLGRASGETPLQHALRLGAQVEAAEGPLRVLAGEVDEALWAPPNGLKPEVSAGAAREAQRALSATLPRRKRVRAALRLGRPTL
ncbi:MAG TPA: DUF3488 and transglutaminase-like domain-containing protein, partial [Actinomycetota bacterium]|nr:DUF3488 and transglutaminase-like domain-containing protein [Actinomycetota bacterium]